ATVLASLLGAFLFELFRVIAVFRDGKSPSGLDWFLSVLFVVLGALVPLLYGVRERNFLEVAQLGISVPGLISGGFRVATSSDGDRNGGNGNAKGHNPTMRYLALRS
ncbi:MAG: hypothetical protein M3063_06900, partial [Actinomycetota bacterium]|nr:hypothetical protein [Actinomycetota bacterium]